MTVLATTTCNSNILDVLNNKMNENKQQLNMVLVEHDEKRNNSTPHVCLQVKSQR
jgi:hypothetical protein